MSEIKEGVENYEDEKNEEKLEKFKKYNDINSLLNAAKKDFIEDGISKSIDFLDIQSENFEKESFSQFEAFVNKDDKYSLLGVEFADYSDAQKMTISKQLKQEIINSSIKYRSTINTVEDILSEEFEKNGKKGKKLDKIEDNLKKLSPNELNKLLKSEGERLKFVEKNYKKTEYEKIDETDNIVNELNLEGINTDNLTQKQIEVIQKFIEQSSDLSSGEFLTLLSVFNDKQKITLLKHFKSTFTLDDLLKYNVVTKEDANLLIKKSLKEIYPSLSNSEIKKLIPNIKEGNSFGKDIIISVNDIEKLGDKPIKNLFKEKRLLEKVNSTFTERQVELAQGDLNDKMELDEKGNIHQNFIELIKKDHKNVGDKTRKTIENFKSGSYIKLRLNGKNNFYKVDQIELGGDSIQSKLFTRKNLNSPFGDGLLNPRDAESENMSYEKLYTLFRETNKLEGADVEFIDEKEFEEDENTKFNDGFNNINSEKDLKEKLIKDKRLDESLKDTPLNELCFVDDKDAGKSDKIPFFRYFQATTGNSLVFEGSNQEMTFSDFFAEIQKGGEGNYKFEKRAYSASDVLDKEPFKDSIVLHKSGKKLVSNEYKNNSDAPEITDFINSNGDRGIHIYKTEEGKIEYAIGKYETKIEKKGEGKKAKITKRTRSFKPDEKLSFNNYNDFALHVDKLNLSADISGKQIETEEDKKKEELLKSEGSIAGKIFKNSSILELIQGGNMLVDSVKEHFEHGNKLRAAKFAQKWGKILPDHISTKLRSKAEKETNDLINERIDQWKVMGSDVATKDIKKNILLNPHAEDHEVLAAMQYMVEKNGTLYAKDLLDLRPGPNGTYADHLWFRKLGGTKEQFEKEKAKITKSDGSAAAGRDDFEVFNPEKLAMSVLSDGASSGRFPSKIHKDFWGKVETGHKKRMEKGVEETSMYYTASDKVEYTLKYLGKGEASRFIGAMEKTLGKDSDEYSMNVMPFALGMSGFSKTWHSGQITELHRLDGTTAYPTLEMMKSDEGVDLYQDAIKIFVKNVLGEDELKRLNGLTKPYSDKGGDTFHKFFMDHKELLTNFITLRDGYAATRRDDEPVLGQFYDRITAKFKDDEYSLNEDSIKARTYESTAFADSLSKLNKIKISAQDLSMRGNTEAERLFDVYTKRLQDIKKIPSIEYNKKIGISDKDRKKLWKRVFDLFEAHISETGTQLYAKYSAAKIPDYTAFYNSQVMKLMNKNNLLLSIGENNPNKIERSEFLDKAYDHFMNGGTNASNIGEEVSDMMQDILDGKVEKVKEENETVYEDENSDFDNPLDGLER